MKVYIKISLLNPVFQLPLDPLVNIPTGPAVEGGEGGREGEEGEEEVPTEPVALLECHKLKVWKMVESENVSSNFLKTFCF